MPSDQTDLGFPKVIPPDHALVKAHLRRRVGARQRTPHIIDVECGAEEVSTGEVTTEPVANSVSVAPVIVKADNPIVVMPPTAESPQSTQLGTPEQHIQAISDQLKAFRSSYTAKQRVFDEQGALKSETEVTHTVWGLTRAKTFLAVFVAAVVAVAVAAITHSDWLPGPKVEPPAAKPYVLKPVPYGPPTPPELIAPKPAAPKPTGPKTTRQGKKDPPSWWRQLGKDLGLDN